MLVVEGRSGKTGSGRVAMAGRRVIRCNVNNLLLAVIVLESIFLGWYLLAWLTMAPALGEMSPSDETKKAADKIPIKVEDPEEGDTHWTATGLSTCVFVTGLVFFLLQLVALIALVLGYQRQNHKPLGIFLLWLVVASLFLIVVGIITAVVADTWLPEQLTTSGHKTALTTRNKGTGTEGKVYVPDLTPKGPALDIAFRDSHRINCFLVPLLIFKIISFIFELFAVFMAIKYFKSLDPVPAGDTELKAKETPKAEKEALVENA